MLWNRLARPPPTFAQRGLFRPFRHNGRAPKAIGQRFNSSNPQNAGQYKPDPTDQNESEEGQGKGRKNDSDPNLRSTILKMLETAATTAASIAILG
jgi:hypothetical protein